MKQALARALLLTSTLAACATSPSPVSVPHRAAVRVTFDLNPETTAVVSGEAAPARPVTADDPVRIASVSKLFVAFGVMKLVEAGKLDLDRDVSEYLGWQLRNPSYPEVRVTLRQLLSHTSSLTDAGDYIVPLGQTLSGFIGAASWDAVHAPGDYFRYSNLNFPVVASVVERVSGERFDRFMSRAVLTPLRLDACFNWSGCTDAAIVRAVVLRASDGSVRRDDLGGRRPDCLVVPQADGACDLDAYSPGSNGALFSPQGGLRISANDLTRAGRMLLAGGMVGGRRFLAAESIAAMITPQWRYDGANGDTEGGFYCAYGLAVQIVTADPRCRDDPFGDGRRRFGHGGDAYNLKSALWLDREAASGIAYFVIAVSDDAPRGQSAYTREEEALARGTALP